MLTVCVNKSVRNGQITGRTIRGFHLSIMRHRIERQLQPNSMPRTQQIPSINHRIYQIWPSDFILFPTLNLPHRDTRFDWIEAMKQNSWKELKAYWKVPIKSVSKTVKNAGICILHKMRPSLTATE